MTPTMTPKELCAACKGKCCTHMPGSYHPDDVERATGKKLSVDALLEMFLTGKVAVDWWDGDPRTSDDDDTEDILNKCYYLRPRIKGMDRLKHPMYGGEAPCIHWTIEKGCELPEDKKPYQCLKLIPSQNFPKGCETKPEDKATKHQVAIAWVPYQDIIEDAIGRYNNLNRPVIAP